jgi:dihydroorotase-like cyclic amidohydrolase
MMVLSGGDIVLPDRILTSASLIVEGDRIAAIDTTRRTPSAVAVIDARESFIVPGFVDVMFMASTGMTRWTARERLPRSRRGFRVLG